MVTHTCDPSTTQEAEAGKSEVQHHPRLHSEFKASLGCVRPCVKQIKRRYTSNDLKTAPRHHSLKVPTPPLSSAQLGLSLQLGASEELSRSKPQQTFVHILLL